MALTATATWTDLLEPVGGPAYRQPHGRRAEFQARYARLAERYAERIAFHDPSVRVDLEAPVAVRAAVPWLALLQRRITDSILPEGFEPDDEQEWLTSDVAGEAGRFFRDMADLLPSVPYIYASENGDLVAEFVAASGVLTVVVGADASVVFGASRVDDRPPETVVIGRGSNSGRESVRDIVSMITAGRHGRVGASR